jgi:prepilin-type N-terminal cleavage/methylation domain-containing protein
VASHSRTTSARTGFTLLELVLVMAILTLMVAIVAPSLTSFAVGRKTSYAGIQLVAMAKFARTQAVIEGRTYRMNFDPQARAAWLTVQDAGQFVAPSSSMANRIEFDERITLRTDLTAQPPDGEHVDFRPDGRTGDGPVHVWVSDPQGRVVEMACLSPTELFHVLPPEEMTTQ